MRGIAMPQPRTDPISLDIIFCYQRWRALTQINSAMGHHRTGYHGAVTTPRVVTGWSDES
ncbi:MAG: hypothetical protein A3I62_01925 [Betaproteobacteria bacterium RIFCSPLOWO2_02_FULL_62_79]|nr:MAG: hypothetical protein A3I62_01925 [Betaproteobacteria bacterium RIFCSPLOWO2_02_FULL_62_79]